MGSKFFKPKKDTRVLMVGLDNAGKTTILCRLKLGLVMATTPTVGFNVETVRYKKLRFCIWDVGGQDKIRGLWRHYYQNTQAVVFVVDSSDRDRLQEAKTELTRLIQEPELANAFVLVLANKQDLSLSLSGAEVAEHLGLAGPKTITKNEFKVQPCCAMSGIGLEEGLEWMSNTLTSRHKKRAQTR